MCIVTQCGEPALPYSIHRHCAKHADWYAKMLPIWKAEEMVDYTLPAINRTIRFLALEASDKEKRQMSKKLAKLKTPQVLPAISTEAVGINKLIRQSYGIMAGVCRGEIAATTAVAAARNCDNVLKGLSLRAKYGTERLRF